MQNSPTICQWFVAEVLDPFRKKHPQTTMYHYIHDILIATKTSSALDIAPRATTTAVQWAGLTIDEGKIQQMPS